MGMATANGNSDSHLEKLNPGVDLCFVFNRGELQLKVRLIDAGGDNSLAAELQAFESGQEVDGPLLGLDAWLA